MLITAIISVGLDIQNTINLYSNLEENIKNILNDKFVNKCFRGKFIKNINRILRVSDCMINQEGVPGYGTIDVIFEADCLVFAIGEVLTGCEVISKDKKLIICNTENARVFLNAVDILESVQVGQLISVRVGAVRYNIGSHAIAINALPHLFNKSVNVYKVESSTEDIKTFLQPMLERVREEEAAAQELNTGKAWGFFNQLLYAYKTEQKPSNGATEHNIFDLISNFPKEIKYISRDNRSDLSKPIVYGYTEEPQPAKTGLSLKEVLLIILGDYCDYLRTVREMIQVYSTAELMESHKNIWAIYKISKLQ